MNITVAISMRTITESKDKKEYNTIKKERIDAIMYIFIYKNIFKEKFKKLLHVE